MSAEPWPPEPPPLEAYSRVTDPGRFHPLHQLALDLLERLGAEYDVSRTEVFDPPPGVQPVEHARPPVRLVPAAPAAAPIAVAFTPFPSLIVRCGRCLVDSFPSCGCDACRETADGEGERLRTLVSAVVAGRFREQVTIPLFGDATVAWDLGGLGVRGGYQSRHARVPRARARALLGGGPHIMLWQPWQTR